MISKWMPSLSLQEDSAGSEVQDNKQHCCHEGCGSNCRAEDLQLGSLGNPVRAGTGVQVAANPADVAQRLVGHHARFCNNFSTA
jgi:hypothetical protein